MPSITKFSDLNSAKRRAFGVAALVLWSMGLRAAPALPGVSAPTRPAEPVQWGVHNVRFPPVVWWETERDRRFLMASLLYWDWADKTSSQKLLLPLFYYGREDNTRFFVSLPLVMAYSRPGESWWVAGNVFRSKDARMARTAFFPLYWQQSRIGGGRVTSLLPVLFYDYRSADRSRVDQVWLGGYRRVRGADSRGVVLNTAWARSPDTGFFTFFPLYWHTRTPDGGMDVAGTFYRKWETAPEGRRRWAGLFPLAGWGGSDGTARVRSHYLFPVYFYSREFERTTWLTLLASRDRRGDRARGHLGLYFYDKDPDQRTDGVFPLWSRAASRDGFFHRTQVLNFVNQREGDQRFQTLFPLYGYWRTPEGSRFLSWGVWRCRTDLWTADGTLQKSDVTGWAFLYHWKDDSEGRRSRVLFPVVWRYNRPPDWKMDLVFPFYFHYRDGPLSLTATPFFIHSRRESQEAWSWLFFYWKNEVGAKKAHLLFPFYYREVGPQRRVWATPVYWSRRSATSREGAFPLGYWYHSAEKDRTFVLPFFGRSRVMDRSWWVAGPVYRVESPGRDSHGVFPLWGRFSSPDDSGSYFLPFYWASGNGRGDRRLVLPLFLTYVEQSKMGTPERERRVNYLLLGSVVQKGSDLSHGFFPLYQYVREKDFENFWAPRILPLVAWERRPAVRQGYVFPFWWRRSPEYDGSVFFPLWYSHRRYAVDGGTATVRGAPQGTFRVLFPLYWHGRSETRTATFVPPLYAQVTEGRRRWRVVTPLGWSVDAQSGGKFRLFFPVYWRVVTAPKPENPAKDISVVGPWYRVRSTTEGIPTRTVGLAPFFSSTAQANGDRSFDVLGGLVGRDRRGENIRYRFLYFLSWIKNNAQ